MALKSRLYIGKKKVKVKFALEEVMSAQSGVQVWIYSLTLALEEAEWSTPRPGRFTSGTHCTGGWVDPQPVWMGAKDVAFTGIRSPDHPACSEPLYMKELDLRVFSSLA